MNRQEYQNQYYLKNRDKLLERKKIEYLEGNIIKPSQEKKRQYNQTYRKKCDEDYIPREINPERGNLKKTDYCSKWYLKNKERLVQKSKLWKKENPLKVRLQTQKRRVWSGIEKIKIETIKGIFDIQDGKCFYCDTNLDEYHIDHIIPLSKGGEHKSYNLVLSCPRCNLKKNNRDPEVFVKRILEIT